MDRERLAFALMYPADQLFGALMRTLKLSGFKEPTADRLYESARLILHTVFKHNNALVAQGAAQIPNAGGVLIASNHQSWSDVELISVTCPRRMHFLAKAEFRAWPVLRHLIDLVDAPYIHRGGDPAGLQGAIEALERGRVLGIFPEGTIPGEEALSRDAVEPKTGLLRGHTGAVRLAIGARVPIVPCGVSGSGASLPPEVYPRLELLQPPKAVPITVRFGEPISYEAWYGKEPSKTELRKLTDELMQRISALVEHERNYIPLTLPIKPPPRVKKLGVLVLHGFTSSVKTVSGLVPHLERHKIPYAMPVLRGHGTSYQDLKGVTAKDWYDDAEKAFLELAQKVDKVALVGLSMGGLVALDLAIQHADKVAGVVTWAAAMRFVNPLARLASVVQPLIPEFSSPEAFNDRTLKTQAENYPRFPTDAFASLVDYAAEIERRLGEVQAPLCVLHSKKDQVIEPVAANIIYRDVSSAHREIHWFHRSGHEMGQDCESAEVFATTMAFLQRLRRR